MNPHIERATTICEAILRTEGQRPLYVVGMSEAAHLGQWVYNSWCWGWTSPTLDLQLQAWLESCGRWQGRGAAMLLRDDVLNGPALVDTALHELSHIVENACPLAMLPTDQLPEWVMPAAAAIGRGEGVKRAEVSRKDDEARQASFHGERFTRAAAHVRHRAALLGYRTTLRAMSVDHGQQVAAALDLELRDRECESIGSILDSEPPAAFSRVWQSLAAA